MSTVTSAAAAHRADACDTLDDLAHEHFDRVVANASVPARAAQPAPTQPALSAAVIHRLRAHGIDALWSHQADAVDALRAGRPGGAGIDVFESEPVTDPHDPLLAVPNLVATPHIGYVTREEWEIHFAVIFDQVLAFEAGQPFNVINPEGSAQ